MEVDALLADDMGKYYKDPLGFVMYSFPWATEEIIQQVEMSPTYQEKYGLQYGPDSWAIEFLEKLGEEVQKGEYPLRFSTASGHGIGKTTLVAWLILWIMSTRPLCNGVVTANTIDQLRYKTWSELKKWLDICITGHWFHFASGRGNLAIRHVDYLETWKCIAQTAKEENSESFQGLHGAGTTPFFIFDEASGVPDKIFEVRDWGITDGEAMVFDFGNPTRNSGRFFENTVGRSSHLYTTSSIDSRTVSITNKKLIKQEIDLYGEDSDRIKVRVKGQFPSIGTNQFIDSDSIDSAMSIIDLDQKDQPLVMGVDVARFGNDDTVIYPRMGLDARSFKPIIISGQDTVFVVGRVIELYHYFKTIGKVTQTIFVDANGVGAGVYDQLKSLGYPVVSVFAQHAPLDKNQYRTKTDEMWGEMKDSIQAGLRLPLRTTDIGSKLYSQLSQREFDYTLKGQIALESKSDMKDRVGEVGLDIADALALTYYYRLQPTHTFGPQQSNTYRKTYNPFDKTQVVQQPKVIQGRYYVPLK